MKDLDPVIHQPVRLGLMASLMSLAPKEKVDFSHLREVLKLTDGNLGSHLLKLEEAGYISVDKTFVGRKPKSFISATSKGRAAFEEHVEALEEILYGS